MRGEGIVRDNDPSIYGVIDAVTRDTVRIATIAAMGKLGRDRGLGGEGMGARGQGEMGGTFGVSAIAEVTKGYDQVRQELPLAQRLG